MEINKKDGRIVIFTDNKNEIEFGDNKVVLDGVVLDFQGEYEKGGVLASVMDVGAKKLFSLRADEKNIAYINYDNLEIIESITDFFGNIDILVILGDKNSVKMFEELEPKIVIPFGDLQDQFLVALGQNIEKVKKYKLREIDFSGEITIFVNIE